MTSAQTATSGTPRPVIRHADDVSAIVNAGPQGGGHANIIVALALGGVFLDAYDLTTLSYGIGDVQKHFGLSTSATGMVAAAMSAGTIVGSIAGGWLTDRIGRYAVFMADMICFVIAALVAGMAPTATILILARFAMGFGVGMDLPVAMAFLSEFSKLSGKGSKASRAAAWCPTWYAASSLCFFLVFALDAVVPATHPDWLWRASLAFGALPALLIILVRNRYMSESPIWIARNGDLEKAAEILRASHGIDPVLQIEAPPIRPQPHGIAPLFRQPLLKRGILVSIISIVSAYSYAAIAFGAPSLLAGMLHLDRKQVLITSIILNLVFAFTGGLIGVRLARYVSSRKVNIAGYILQAISIGTLAIVGTPQSTAGVISVLAGFAGYLFGQGFGPGCQQMIYATLTYPTEIRGVGIGMNRLISGLGATMAMWALPSLYANFGTNLFWFILSAPLIGLTLHQVIRWDVFNYDPDGDDTLKSVLRPTPRQDTSLQHSALVNQG
ncbi:MFS transporter [Gluconobacter cerinus]|uniref:MFS transporter n=1 Tax=Gluconobacter cerinus TaxID=38307 RepID=UPI00193EE593|nr:MFS transporter [Gluconobacter cerinus]MBM3098875.1 MFS transporter [Gluconobacter cerinus]